jgi:hypothetical protein
MAMAQTVPVVSSIPGSQIKSSEAGLGAKLTPRFFGETTWSDLAAALSDFSQHVSKALDAAANVENACFHVDQVEVSAVVTADGKLALLGSSLGGGAEGGVKFVWRRRTQGTKES